MLQIRPNVSWPVLEDNGNEVEQNFEKGEDSCVIANAGFGTKPKEI